MRYSLLIAFLLLPCTAQGFCTLGADGNFHSDEDPFVDAANHDFRLKPGSCAVDNGATIEEVKFDFDGVPRPQGNGFDIGAFELIQDEGLDEPDKLKVE